MNLRRPGGNRLKLIGISVAGVLLAALAVNVLTAGVPVRPSPPQLAKPFTLRQLSHPDRQLSLASYAGEPVILNFFASWCPPCRRETPLLARFYRDHHGHVLIIGIDARDESKAALKFLHATGVSYPVVADPTLDVTIAYGLGPAGIPQTFFLNARHQIVRHIFGGVTLSELNSWASGIGTHRIGAS